MPFLLKTSMDCFGCTKSIIGETLIAVKHLWACPKTTTEQRRNINNDECLLECSLTSFLNLG